MPHMNLVPSVASWLAYVTVYQGLRILTPWGTQNFLTWIVVVWICPQQYQLNEIYEKRDTCYQFLYLDYHLCMLRDQISQTQSDYPIAIKLSVPWNTLGINNVEIISTYLIHWSKIISHLCRTTQWQIQEGEGGGGDCPAGFSSFFFLHFFLPKIIGDGTPRPLP